jgi:hypothetical protein
MFSDMGVAPIQIWVSRYLAESFARHAPPRIKPRSFFPQHRTGRLRRRFATEAEALREDDRRHLAEREKEGDRIRDEERDRHCREERLHREWDRERERDCSFFHIPRPSLALLSIGRMIGVSKPQLSSLRDPHAIRPHDNRARHRRPLSRRPPDCWRASKTWSENWPVPTSRR